MVEIEGIPYFLNPKYRDDFTREIDRHSVFCPGSKIRRSIILERLKYAPKKLKDLIWRIELHHVYGYWRLDFFNLRSDDSDYVWAELLQLFGGVFQNIEGRIFEYYHLDLPPRLQMEKVENCMKKAHSYQV